MPRDWPTQFESVLQDAIEEVPCAYLRALVELWYWHLTSVYVDIKETFNRTHEEVRADWGNRAWPVIVAMQVHGGMHSIDYVKYTLPEEVYGGEPWEICGGNGECGVEGCPSSVPFTVRVRPHEAAS